MLGQVLWKREKGKQVMAESGEQKKGRRKRKKKQTGSHSELFKYFRTRSP